MGDPPRLATAVAPDGIDIRYEVAGAGTPAIVFVHGWACDRSYWRGQVPAFTAGHLVLTVDLAGHGDSEAGRASWTMPAFGGDVAAVVLAESLDDVVLVGHSMGGDVILEAAVLLGERVRGVVWVDTYRTLESHGDTSGLDAYVDTFRKDLVGATRAFVHRAMSDAGGTDLVEWVAADMSSAEPGMALDALDHAIHGLEPAKAAIARISAPIVALNSTAVPAEVESLARHGVRHVLVEGVKHFSMLEDPAQVNRLLDEVVARLPAPKRIEV